jgi:regulator of sigma E protease
MNYVLAFLIIGLTILIHEAGHFIAARIVRIPIARFSIGFGPKLFSFKRKETEYWISAVPVGGYVLPQVEEVEQFYGYPVWKRNIFSLGGPTANILTAAVLLAIMNIIQNGFSIYGVTVQPLVQTFGTVALFLAAIPSLFSDSGNLSGVVGIISQGGGFIGGNAINAIRFGILINLNLAVLNLLPFPVLDGGKIVLNLLEKIHPHLRKLHYPLSIAGWLIIMGLMVYVTVIDVTRIV